LRVADIWGQTNGSANWAFAVKTPPPRTGAYTLTDNYQQTNKWIGAGPRLAIDGIVPLQGAWSIDYNGGVAALFGHGSGQQAGVHGSVVEDTDVVLLAEGEVFGLVGAVEH